MIQDVCRRMGVAVDDARSALTTAGIYGGPSDRYPLETILAALEAGNVRPSRLATIREARPPSRQLPSVRRRSR